MICHLLANGVRLSSVKANRVSIQRTSVLIIGEAPQGF